MILTLNNIKFIYLNCKKDKERKKYFLNQWSETCNDYGSFFKIERFNAIYYKDLLFSHFNELFDIPNNSSIKSEPPNIAVFKSHQAIYKKIIDENIEYTLIFEDDVIIPKDFLKKLDKIITHPIEDWDVLFLAGWSVAF